MNMHDRTVKSLEKLLSDYTEVESFVRYDRGEIDLKAKSPNGWIIYEIKSSMRNIKKGYKQLRRAVKVLKPYAAYLWVANYLIPFYVKREVDIGSPEVVKHG